MPQGWEGIFTERFVSETFPLGTVIFIFRMARKKLSRNRIAVFAASVLHMRAH
jgi:hypothetical protein